MFLFSLTNPLYKAHLSILLIMLQIKFSLLKHIMEISLSSPIVAQTLEVIVALIGSATQGHAHVWARAAAESHVRIQGLLKPGSVLMPNVPVTIEGQADSRDGGPCWCFRAILLLGTW